MGITVAQYVGDTVTDRPRFKNGTKEFILINKKFSVEVTEPPEEEISKCTNSLCVHCSEEAINGCRVAADINSCNSHIKSREKVKEEEVICNGLRTEGGVIMKLTAEDIEMMKNNKIAWGLLDEETQDKFGSVSKHNLICLSSTGWRNANNDNRHCREVTYRLRRDYELPSEEEEKVYQWVYKTHKYIDVRNVVTTEEAFREWLNRYQLGAATHYGKLQDVLQSDGSINLSKMKEVER
jgi:hypothetical protein